LFHWLSPLNAGKNVYESEWAREDSNLQPDRYERTYETEAKIEFLSILRDF
jgi:hypothetical protein